MEFRPCIDIHDGKVKQIVGGSLKEDGQTSLVKENFVSKQDSAFYANLYKKLGIKGGHVILLNKEGTPEYELTKAEAIAALNAYPGGLQVGGGINPDNATIYLEAGASQVIITSYVFKDGRVDYDNLNNIKNTVGSDKLVLDLSCRKRDGKYYIVTDRWQKFTDETFDLEILKKYEEYCCEYLIHAVDMEGKNSGVDDDILEIFDKYHGNPVTYAGGIHSYDDISHIKELTHNKANITIGSALDLFGGKLEFDIVLELIKH